MASEVWAAVIGGAAGLATGALGSVLAPWVNWGVEKKRLDRQYKRDLIASWRAGIASTVDEPNEDGFLPASTYFTTTWYETLRPFLPKANVANTEQMNMGLGHNKTAPRAAKNFYANEVDRIEREWGLRPKFGKAKAEPAR